MLVRARITADWGGRGYVPIDVVKVMSYSIDSAMDTDTDSWNLTIGDFENSLVPMLSRDSEVRVQIYGFGDGSAESLNFGFADEITLDQSGQFVFTGRDITAAAVDSQHPPQIWHSIMAHSLVAKEAAQLKIANSLTLAKTTVFKTYVTDGSESFWDVWYRFYRKKRMWLWAEPDGSLNSGFLNYNAKPAYFFGSPRRDFRSARWLGVEQMEWRSNKQQRIAEVYFFGHTGKKSGFVAHAVDPAMSVWVKRPVKIITSGHVYNSAEAMVEAQDEIFEGMVGAVEIKLLIENPGFIIRQNRMAIVNLPEIGLSGEFFVVGTQQVGSVESGRYQQVRLREKNYAVSKRRPDDPGMKGTGVPRRGDVPPSNAKGDLAKAIQGASAVRWAGCFIDAATEFHGPWPFDLFLGVLLAICDWESYGFHNVRRGGHTEWPGTHDHKPPSVFDKAAYEKFKNTFANEPDYAVGPMQLLTQGYKLLADKIGLKNYGWGPVGDELLGGRWLPCANILAAAAALNEKLGGGVHISPDGTYTSGGTPSGLSLNPTYDFIWGFGTHGEGVAGYGEGDYYAHQVKKLYDGTWKDVVANGIQSAPENDPVQPPMAYDNPFRNADSISGGRIDMGVDYAAANADPIYAIANAVIDVFIPTGWLISSKRWACIGYRITDGPAQGLSVYLAEYITPVKVWKVGDIVSPNTVLAHFIPGLNYEGNGIEMGWAEGGNGNPLALSYYPGGGRMTAHGENFDQLMRSLGAIAGRQDHPPPVGSLPDGFPRW